MSKKPVQQCQTCKYCDILRTPTGRPKRGRTGSCTVLYEYPSIVENLKIHLRIRLPIAASYCVKEFNPYTHGVDPTYGEDCNLWEPMEDNP